MTAQSLYLICIPLIIAAEYCFARNQLGESRQDRWLTNVSLGFINEAVVLASPVWIALLLPTPEAALLPGLWGALLAFVLMDLFLYWLHRGYHAFGLMWRLHRVHHCDLDLDFTTSFRHHPGEVVANLVIIYALMAGFGFSPLQVAPYLVFARLVQLVAHANIRLESRTSRLLQALLVTPDVHEIHHSPHQPLTDSNYGEVLTIWDRLFGTFTAPRPLTGPVNIGLAEFRAVDDQRLGALLRQPLR
ncbi:MAG: sterol desaturase family protein [Marinobacter sp.]|uniref:sterol desaturase family protein n=1 Tax=Marinobacter sp. TaxID=50741 RepID=UPI00299E8350|nr:sterol desaturase family protein [Marinobacter sp.]MDX1633083.1 sterol desaturase family protein [Marinobacter sp.]